MEYCKERPHADLSIQLMRQDSTLMNLVFVVVKQRNKKEGLDEEVTFRISPLSWLNLLCR